MRLCLILLLLFSTLIAPVAAQDTITMSSITESVPLWQTGNVFLSNSKAGNFRDINSIKYWVRLDSLTLSPHEGSVWLKTTVCNDLIKPSFFDFNFLAADSILVFAKNSDTSFVVFTGPYTSVRTWLYPEKPGLVPIFCQPGQSFTLYIRLWSDKGRTLSVKQAFVQTRRRSLDDSVESFRNFVGRIEFNGFFLGAVTFAMLFFLFIFIKVREPVFLLYGLYLLGAAMYAVIVKTLPYSFLAKIAYLNYPLTYKLGEPVQYIFFAVYMAFGKSLLDIEHGYGLLNKVIRYFIIALLGSGLLLLAYNFYHFDYQLQKQAFILSRIVILPIAIILLIWITISVNNPVKWFFISGSFFFIAGGLLAVMVDPKSRHLFFGELNANPIIFFKTGILLESLCFAMALGYKIRTAQIEKNKASKAYIDQLELNKEMAASEKIRLEKMVNERTEEIVEKNRVIEQQRQVQIQSTFDKQLSEMEMTALRSQMNPHFIFNSLNSIRYQILSKDYDNAATYLTRFSKLLRFILQNSRENIISLSEEIEMNMLYVQLESLRFSQGFKFNLTISEKIDLSEIMVPPMFLQPYVENAVKHGLVPSKKAVKELLIDISPFDDGYCIIVEDNGIGRKAASSQTMLYDKKSLGMQIARERIELFNINYQPFIDVLVEDLYEQQGACGTRITFTYKDSK
ncbi:sensor histidine kinase [Dyadobacter psychrotolerans]|uniref:Sensor protein lytS n=1 Tax=Dyadobacter psychrotolerans TaxID=2541721 RepID=A0A4R5DZL5_9BACT|nr:histidine kinase [Dyadobacter psychrotolerans]TDE18020.1 hypothetical protein E0F88_00230 [Dyadobacter psychrotolerans]